MLYDRRDIGFDAPSGSQRHVPVTILVARIVIKAF